MKYVVKCFIVILLCASFLFSIKTLYQRVGHAEDCDRETNEILVTTPTIKQKEICVNQICLTHTLGYELNDAGYNCYGVYESDTGYKYTSFVPASLVSLCSNKEELAAISCSAYDENKNFVRGYKSLSDWFDNKESNDTYLVLCFEQDVCMFVSQNVTVDDEHKTFEIFGDSYSSFEADIVSPENAYYGIDETADIPGTVKNSCDMWYSIVEECLGWDMMRNDSVSGSCISYSYYDDGRDDPTGQSFITRIRDRFNDSASDLEDPDVIFIFGGTNDNWAHAPLGEVMYSGWTEEDLNNVLPAVTYVFDYIQQHAPNTQIIFVMNNFDNNEEMTSQIKNICEHYNVVCVDWCADAVEKESLHPTVNGMQSIADNIIYTIAHQ